MDTIKVVIYEDDEADRVNLGGLFARKKEVQLLESFFNCDSVEKDIDRLRTDIVLMDVEMPGTNGLQGLMTIKANHSEIDVIMLTAHDKDEYIFNCIKSGASGYIIKGTSYPELIDVVKTVYNGGAEFSPPIANKIRDFIRNGFPQNQGEIKIKLTEKQEKVLSLLYDGLSKKMIADKMGISENGVASHMKNIFIKLPYGEMIPLRTLLMDYR